MTSTTKDPITLLLDWPNPLSYTPHPGITDYIAHLPIPSLIRTDNTTTTIPHPNTTTVSSSSSLSSSSSASSTITRSTDSSSSSALITTSGNSLPSVNDTVPNNLPYAFGNVDEYHRIYAPLLIEEIREIARQHIPEPDVSPLYFMYDGYILQPSTASTATVPTTESTNTRNSLAASYKNPTSITTGKKRIVRKHHTPMDHQSTPWNSTPDTRTATHHPTLASPSSEANLLSSSSSSFHNLEASVPPLSSIPSWTSSSSSTSTSTVNASSIVTLVFSYTKRRQYEWEDEQRSKGLSPDQASLSWTSHPTNRTLVLLSPEPLALYQYRKSLSASHQRWKPDNLEYYIPSHVPCPIMIGLCTWTIGDQNAARFDIQVHYEQFNKAMDQYQNLLQYRQNIHRSSSTSASNPNHTTESSSVSISSLPVSVSSLSASGGTTTNLATSDEANVIDLTDLDDDNENDDHGAGSTATNRKRRLSEGMIEEDIVFDDENNDEAVDSRSTGHARKKKSKGDGKTGTPLPFRSSSFHPIMGTGKNDVFASNNRYTVPESWFCWNLANIVTGLRELSALCSIEALDKQLLRSLFQPNPHLQSIPPSLSLSTTATTGNAFLPPSLSSSATATTRNRLKYLSPDYHKLYLMRDFNSSQREAIEAALKYEGNDSFDDENHGNNNNDYVNQNNSAITLIQGPPGTGKTTTILGLINSLHIAAYGHYYETLLGTVPLPSSSAITRSNSTAPSKVPSRSSTPPPLIATTSSASESLRSSSSSTVSTPATLIPSSSNSHIRDVKLSDTLTRSSTVPSVSSSSTTRRTSSSTLQSAVPAVVAAVPLKTVAPLRTQSSGGGMLSLSALLKSTEKSLLEKDPSLTSSSSTSSSSSTPLGSFTPDTSYASRGHGSLRYLLTSTTPIDHCLHAVASAFRLKPRILVTAPSNTAVDGIILRLVKEQLRSGVLVPSPPASASSTSTPATVPSLARYSPPIKRVGEACSNDVRNLPGVYIEAEVDRLLSMVQDPIKLTNWQQKLENDRKIIMNDLQNQRNAFQNHPIFIQWKQHQYQQQQQLLTTNVLSSTGMGNTDLLNPLLTQFSGKITQISEAYERTRMKLAQLHLLQSLTNTDTSSAYANQNQRNDVRRGLRNLLLEDAQIVFTTTSSAALGTLEAFVTEAEHSFPICIIDEAAQAIEPSTLIPFRYNTKQVILVGDPQQLPATIISRVALRYGLDRSLFGRLAQGNHPVHMLRVQYRSHPAIAAFPSAYFYGGKLRDSDPIRHGLRYNIFHKETCFRPLLFYDCQIGRMEAYTSNGNRAITNNNSSSVNGNNTNITPGFFVPTTMLDTGEISTGPSFRNIQEARFVVRLIQALNDWRGEETSHHPPSQSTSTHTATGTPPTKIKFSGTVGIISFYRAQVNYLMNEIAQRFRWPPSTVSNVVIPGIAEDTRIPLHFTLDINTVDGYQGQERDIIILSCVRTIKLPANPNLSPTKTVETEITEIEDGEITTEEKTSDTIAAAATTTMTTSSSSVNPSIGFLNDPRRINVALTRAKYACWTIGNSNALETSTHWRAFVEHCRSKECVIPLTTMDDINEKPLSSLETIKNSSSSGKQSNE